MSESFTFDVATHGSTTALVYRAREPIGATLILAHGAGAAQTHPFMVDMAERISRRGIDVVTFNFLYTEAGRKMPDRSDLLEACWHAAIASVRARGGLPTELLFCGGKSMGGRIISNIAASPRARASRRAASCSSAIRSTPRRSRRCAATLTCRACPFPMLFVQGSRDALGDAAEIRKVVRRIPHAALHVVKGGDHSLALLERDGGAAKQEPALEAAADAIAAFVLKIAGRLA